MSSNVVYGGHVERTAGGVKPPGLATSLRAWADETFGAHAYALRKPELGRCTLLIHRFMDDTTLRASEVRGGARAYDHSRVG